MFPIKKMGVPGVEFPFPLGSGKPRTCDKIHPADEPMMVNTMDPFPPWLSTSLLYFGANSTTVAPLDCDVPSFVPSSVESTW